MFEGYEKRLFRWDKEQWYEEFRVSCCWREVWNGNSRCIWHAEVDDKPIQDLLAAQSDELFPMAIDGLYLRNIESSFPDWGRLGGLSFRSCRMIGADFSEAYLKDTDFSEAVLYGSNLSEANLEDADFRGASFNVQISDENSGIPLTWVSSDFSRASLNGADLSYAVLTYVNLADTFANEVDFSNADLEMANLSDADLRGSDFTDAFLVDADLSNAVLQDVDFKGAGIQDATFAGVRMNRETSIGKPNWSLYRDEPEEQDALARAYHRLGEAALENGLIGEARRLRIWERKARRKEAKASGDWQAVAGALLSEYVMGYGVSVRRVSVAIVFTIFASAGVYWYTRTGVSGSGTSLQAFFQALDYSVTTFTGIGSNDGPPSTQPARSIAILESFAGILFSVLLGYVLGTRESP